MHTFRGEFAVSKAHFDRAVTVAERLGDPGWIANMAGHHGMPAFFAGHWDQARVDFERGIALSRQAGSSMVLTYTLIFRGRLRLWAGEWAAARQDLEEELALAECTGDLGVVLAVQGLLAEHNLLEGRPAATRARLVSMLDRAGLAEMDVTGVLPILAWAHLELGDVTAAVEVAGQAVRRARAQSQRLTLVDALRVQALVAIRQHQWVEAEQAMEEGIILAHNMPYPYAEARLLHVYGRMHLQRGEREPARERLEAALAIFRRLGARKDAERVEHALADLPTSME
jgi:tetratricopeptide (TPR) repeat protein